MRVAIQGTFGSFSEAAARRRWPEMTAIPCREVAHVVAAVRERRADAGCLAIENSLIGSVTATYDLMHEAFGDGMLHLRDEILLPVHHCLMGIPGTVLAGVKRAANILGIEEKKDKSSYAGVYDLKLLKEPQELKLAAIIEAVKQDTTAAINVENFAGAMRALAELRVPVDAFFDKVTVNDRDPDIRRNRLKMLSEIRAATLQVADFSKIAG